MATRTQRRIIFFALVLFLIAGIVIVENRPHREAEHSKLFSSLSDIVSSELHGYLPHNTGHLNAAGTPSKNDDPNKDADELELEQCTTISPMRGFIDLRGLSNFGLEGKVQPWMAKDHDSNRNFTLGVCSSPVKKSLLTNASFRDSVNASQIGAYYVDPETKEVISMGEYSGKPAFKGRKLIMTYENGSFCDSVMGMDGQRIRRSTILTFTCDREMLNKAQVSYIASSQDCTYMFEIRSHFACPTAAKADNLAAIWIFLLIFMAALVVFFSGSLIIRFIKVSPPPHATNK